MAAEIIPFPLASVTQSPRRIRAALAALEQINESIVAAHVAAAFRDFWEEKLRRAKAGEPDICLEKFRSYGRG